MASFKSKIIRFLLKNRHLLKGKIRREVINFSTSIPEFRAQITRTVNRIAKLPAGVSIVPAGFKKFYAEWVIPDGCKEEKIILYFHGGGFVSGNSRDHRPIVAKFAKYCSVKCLTFDYSLAPEHPFPAAVIDSVDIYSWLIESGFKPENILFAGDSAGGGILISTLLMLRKNGSPLPAAALAISPCADMTLSGNSHKSKIKADPCTPRGANETFISYYIGKGDPKNPLMSPVFADLTGLCPIMIQTGEDETLLDDSVRLSANAKRDGVDITLHVWKGMFHCFPLLAPMFPEATEAMKEICLFIHKYI